MNVTDAEMFDLEADGRMHRINVETVRGFERSDGSHDKDHGEDPNDENSAHTDSPWLNSLFAQAIRLDLNRVILWLASNKAEIKPDFPLPAAAVPK
jgi:hypothetical protein